MPYNIIEFESEKYPEFQTKGFAAKYITAKSKNIHIPITI